MMYLGPGSGPMLAAASAWQALAGDLSSSATSFQSALSGLTSAWQGPSSATMTSAAAPYLSWITDTATQAGAASAQATAAAGAFETAYAATVPPPLIAANRTLLLALIATNFFGQNSPAIAATEAQYEAMWAQDVAMMQSYAAASQAATSSLQSFTAAPAVANAASGTQSLAAAASSPADSTSISSILDSLLNGLVSNSAISDLNTVVADLGLGGTPGAGLTGDLTALGTALGLTAATDPFAALVPGDLVPIQAAYYALMAGSMPARMFMSMGNSMANSSAALANNESLMTNIGQFIDGKMQAVVGGVSNQLRSWGGAVSAQLAHAANLGGRLSVPPGWSAAATTMSRAAPVLPATSVAAPSVAAPSAGMPGGPFGQALAGALSGRGLNGLGARAPKVVPRSPAGG